MRHDLPVVVELSAGTRGRFGMRRVFGLLRRFVEQPVERVRVDFAFGIAASGWQAVPLRVEQTIEKGRIVVFCRAPVRRWTGFGVLRVGGVGLIAVPTGQRQWVGIEVLARAIEKAVVFVFHFMLVRSGTGFGFPA